MQKILLRTLILVLNAGLMAGCTDFFNDSSNRSDGSAPAIRLQAPIENSAFSVGQDVKIQSVISDKDRIKEMEVQVVKIAEGLPSKTVWSYKKFPTTNPVIVDTTIASAGWEEGEYLLRMNLVDNRTNAKVREVRFTIR